MTNDPHFPPPLAPDDFARLPAIGNDAQTMAIALSGGPDSMALCWLLAVHAAARGAVLHALTVDHGLRPESAAEARRVGQWVSSWPGVRHTVLTWQPPMDAPRTRLMETARAGRYALLAAYCHDHKITRLFTAHHLDDQAETFLFRLAKGSGPDGLAAMRAEQLYDDTLTLARPLLSIPKDRLVATCRAHDIPFVADPTNDNPAFARNRLRQAREVLAAEGLTPKRLGVTAERLRRATTALDHYAQHALQAALAGESDDVLKLDFALLAAQPDETRLRVLLLAMKRMHIPEETEGYGPRREKVESLAGDLYTDPWAFKRRSLGGFLISLSPDRAHIILQKEKSP